MSLIEIKSRNYAWQQSLEKGIKLCQEKGHNGDAETLKDVIAHLHKITKLELTHSMKE